jgi:hypothetical protein
MTAPKHPHSGAADSVPPLTDDLESDPGINDSKGNFARSDANPALIKGENTTVGDVMNDTTSGGGVNLDKERTNK